MALHQALGCWDYEVEIEHLRLVESLNHSFGRYEAADHLVTAVHREGRYNADRRSKCASALAGCLPDAFLQCVWGFTASYWE